MLTRRTVLIPVIVAAFATATPASAQTGNAYGGEGNVLEETTQTQGRPASSNAGEGVEGTARTPEVPSEGGAAAGAPGTQSAGPVSNIAADDVSSLPFTGFDVLLLVAGGLVLVGVGAAMRRLSRTAYE